MRYRTLVFAASLGVLIATGATNVLGDNQLSGLEIKGSLKVIFPAASQTNDYDVSLWSEPPCWELSLTSSTSNHRVFSSPRQTFEVSIYDTPTAGPDNTATIKVFRGSQPLSDRDAEHVWLALLSQNTFLGKKLPVHNPGLGMVEPSTISEVQGTTNDLSPRRMHWNNEFPGGNNSRIEGDFKWLSHTNTLGGLNIPTGSQMAISVSDLDGNRKLVSFSELVIHSIRPLTRPPTQIPKIQGRNVVYDYRLSDFSKSGWSSTSVRYNTFNGEGLEKVPADVQVEH